MCQSKAPLNPYPGYRGSLLRVHPLWLLGLPRSGRRLGRRLHDGVQPVPHRHHQCHQHCLHWPQLHVLWHDTGRIVNIFRYINYNPIWLISLVKTCWCLFMWHIAVSVVSSSGRELFSNMTNFSNELPSWLKLRLKFSCHAILFVWKFYGTIYKMNHHIRGFCIYPGLSATNDGHSVKVTVDESFGASISGSPLSEPYTLAQFHLHWGSKSGQGQKMLIYLEIDLQCWSNFETFCYLCIGSIFNITSQWSGSNKYASLRPNLWKKLGSSFEIQFRLHI